MYLFELTNQPGGKCVGLSEGYISTVVPVARYYKPSLRENMVITWLSLFNSYSLICTLLH